MDFPYCVVDGVEYQLHFDENGTIRFPKIKEDCFDLNNLVIRYFNDDNVDLQTIWEEYTQTGSSYYLVEGIFSPYGMNNHIVTQGKGRCKDMTLFSGNPEVDSQYNLNDDEKAVEDVHNILYRLTDNHEENKEVLVRELTNCLEILKKI